jgi:8-oxo-dGTP pyrophosphatase MutT (NUDIX family)
MVHNFDRRAVEAGDVRAVPDHDAGRARRVGSGEETVPGDSRSFDAERSSHQPGSRGEVDALIRALREELGLALVDPGEVVFRLG